MFQDFHEIEYLDLSNVNTSKVNDMRCMFNECYKLKEIKGKENFNTNQVTNMEVMLQNCTELEYLNLSNFNTSKDNDIGWMFNQCHKLKYLNFSNFSLNNDCLTTNIFHNINKNECKIFISGLNLNNLFQKKII